MDQCMKFDSKHSSSHSNHSNHWSRRKERRLREPRIFSPEEDKDFDGLFGSSLSRRYGFDGSFEPQNRSRAMLGNSGPSPDPNAWYADPSPAFATRSRPLNKDLN